jgi:adenylate cyclase
MAEGDEKQRATDAHSAMPDVFVSYASQDAALADETVEILEQQGISCWIAPRDVTPGAHYADAIIMAISGAKALVLVLSDSALSSKHVGKEVERASSKGRPIIALRTGVAPLPPAFEYFLSESQWIDVGGGGVPGVASKLVEAVRTHLAPAVASGPPSVSRSPNVRPGQHTKRTKWLLAGGAAVLAFILAYFAVARFRSGSPIAGQSSASGMAAVTERAATAVPEKSIAVLPFVDMSEKHDQEYFSDGLSEELIDHLARIPDLKVIARTSAFAFKGKNEDMRTIATKLGVTNLLEGSVRKSGSKLRIAAQLIRASDGAHVWSETYNRDLSDIFALQDEISTTVASALNAALNVSNSDRAQGSSRGTANIDAYKLLLQGNYYFWRADQGDTQRAVDFLRQAIKLDSHYAQAWAKLARAYAWQASTGEVLPAEALAKGREAIKQALAIDPKSAEAYYARGNISRLIDGDWNAAKSDFQRAAELDANGEVGDVARANVLLIQGGMSGQFGDYFEWSRQHLERNPLDTSDLNNLAGVQQSIGQLDESADTFRRLLELNPAYATAHSSYALTLLLLGKSAEALETAKQESDESGRLTALACVYWAMGRRAESDSALSELERGFGNRNQYSIAEVHAYRGEADAAFAWLDRAYQQDKGSLELLKIDPLLQKLRGDPRFVPLLRKAGLPV